MKKKINNQNFYNENKELLQQKILLLSYFYNQKNKVMKTLPNTVFELKKVLNTFEILMAKDKKYGPSVKKMLQIIEKEHKTYLKQKHYTPYEMTFESYIKRQIQISNAQVFGTHEYGIRKLKQQNKNKYIMITVFLKTRFYILTDIKKILEVRNIITNEIKKIEKQQRYHNKNYKIPYLGVMEISSNNHIHLHFYIYEEYDKDEISKINNKIKHKSLQKNLRINIKTNEYIIFKKDCNYSNFYHTIDNKMKGTREENRIVLFVIKKIFSKNKLVNHSSLPFTIETLKQKMKENLEKNIQISYTDLATKLVQQYFNSLNIQINYKAS